MPKTIGDITQELNEKVLTPAKAEADEIIRSAQEKADAIIMQAQAEAENIKAAAMDEAETTRKQLDADMDMAARDFILTVQEKLEDALVKPVVEMEVKDVLADTDFIERMMELLLHEFLKTRTRERSVEVLLPKDKQQELEEWYMKRIRQEAEGAMIVHFDEDTTFGFHIGMADQDSYLNFGSGLVESFTKFVSPRFRKHFFGLEA